MIKLNKRRTSVDIKSTPFKNKISPRNISQEEEIRLHREFRGHTVITLTRSKLHGQYSDDLITEHISYLGHLDLIIGHIWVD